MTYRPVTRRLAIVLGVVFILLGVAETIRDIRGDDGGYVFWFTSLCVGGALILIGVLKLTARPTVSFAAVTLGALAGALATAWTIVGPAASITLIVLAAVDRARSHSRSGEPTLEV